MEDTASSCSRSPCGSAAPGPPGTGVCMYCSSVPLAAKFKLNRATRKPLEDEKKGHYCPWTGPAQAAPPGPLFHKTLHTPAAPRLAGRHCPGLEAVWQDDPASLAVPAPPLPPSPCGHPSRVAAGLPSPGASEGPRDMPKAIGLLSGSEPSSPRGQAQRPQETLMPEGLARRCVPWAFSGLN